MSKRKAYRPKHTANPLAIYVAINGAHKMSVNDQLKRASVVRASVDELAKDAQNLKAWADVFDTVNLIEAFAFVGVVKQAGEFIEAHQDNVTQALDRMRETGSNVLRPVEVQMLRDLAATFAECLAEVTLREYFAAEERVKNKVRCAMAAKKAGKVRLVTPPDALRKQAVPA